MQRFADVGQAADWIVQRLERNIVFGAPLGLGKPNALINALYQRAKADQSISLTLLTALTLEPPHPRHELERRFLEPIIQRLYDDYIDLDYALDRRFSRLPPNIQVIEFFHAPGSLLNNAYAQQHYLASNYTHVARDSLARGINLVCQMVAERQIGTINQYSLSCNPDLSLDVAPKMRATNPNSIVVGQVNKQLPFMLGDSAVEEEFFDAVIANDDLNTSLYSIPKASVSVADYMIGLYASSLIKDGGTLQIGIGSLGDALAYALTLRHSHSSLYKELIHSVVRDSDSHRMIDQLGGMEPFKEGLYGATEMLVDGFQPLIEQGIVKRLVTDAPGVSAAQEYLIHAGFFLGSQSFYQWLRDLDPTMRARINMTSVSRINQLYGSEELDRSQRQHARFVNTCLMVTLDGASVSDALQDHQVLSGVGGQYNFVAMAHELEGARSLMQVRSTRHNDHGKLESNIRWQYPSVTIPRHLRDMVISEYGIADLRGKTDAETIAALLNITDSRFQLSLLKQAKHAGKIDRNYQIPQPHRNNTPERLNAMLEPRRNQDWFPDYPFGSDLTDSEQKLAKRLRTIEQLSKTWLGKLSLLRQFIFPRGELTPELAKRMGLVEPMGIRERVWARWLRDGGQSP